MTKLLTAEAEGKVSFELSAEPGSQVFVAGAFNDWSPIANPMKDNPHSGHFKTGIRLPRGKHQYKFVVNGVWSLDPDCTNWARNSSGSMNSLLYV